MAGRHRRRRGRARWLPALGAFVVLGGAVYGAVLLSLPAAAPAFPVPVSAPASAGTEPEPGRPDRTARVVEVLEGDAFVIDGGATVRVLAADSCEIRTDAGPAARDDAARLIGGATVTLRR